MIVYAVKTPTRKRPTTRVVETAGNVPMRTNTPVGPPTSKPVTTVVATAIVVAAGISFTPVVSRYLKSPEPGEFVNGVVWVYVK